MYQFLAEFSAIKVDNKRRSPDILADIGALVVVPGCGARPSGLQAPCERVLARAAHRPGEVADEGVLPLIVDLVVEDHREAEDGDPSNPERVFARGAEPGIPTSSCLHADERRDEVEVLGAIPAELAFHGLHRAADAP